MNSISRVSVREFILAKAQKKAKLLGIDDGMLESDFSLTGSGIFDSMDILELLTDVEEHFRKEVDLSGFEPSEFATLDGFVNCVISSPQV